MWLFIIGNIFRLFVPLVLFSWAILMPAIAGWTYVGIYAAFGAYLFFVDSCKPDPDPGCWMPTEIQTIRMYHIALRYPVGANAMSSFLNGFRWVGVLLMAPLLLWHHMWIAAAIVVAAFFATSSLSVRLDPFFFLGAAASRGESGYAMELALLRQVLEKRNSRP